MDAPRIKLEARGAAPEGNTAGLKLVFSGSGVKHLLNSGRKQQHPTSWRQDGEQQQDASPSQGAVVVSDSPGRPFSPSSAEGSPPAPPGDAAAPAVAMAGPRSVHGQAPGKQPYPDDRTPEAEALRAKQQGGAAEGPAEGVPAGPADTAGAAAGPRSVHGQPPGKQPHPDDPAFNPAAQGQQQLPPPPPQQSDGGVEEAAAAPGGTRDAGEAGPRSVHGQPPGKQNYQIDLIAQNAKEDSEVEEEDPVEPLQRVVYGPIVQRSWQPQQAGAAPQAGVQQGVGAVPPGYPPAPASSSQQPRQRAAPPAPVGGSAAAEKPSSRKRPASQSAAEGGQRKKAANGSAAGGAAAGQAGGGGLQRLPTGMSATRPYSAGVPASLARSGGDAAPPQQIRPMPGAPRSLQQRQQLLNGAMAGAGAAGRQQAGAPRPRPPAGAPKPKQQPKAASSSQRRPSSAAGGAAGPAAAAAAQQYKPGDVVWAKIGVYPWWPAQLQRPTADEHFRPKHAASDMFCVFYGSNDYNWLPASALKPFTDRHPDYQKHASVKNKALQRAIDEAWVYGLQRQRPDVNYGPYGGA